MPTIDLRLMHSRPLFTTTRIGQSVYSQSQLSAGSSLGPMSFEEAADQHCDYASGCLIRNCARRLATFNKLTIITSRNSHIQNGKLQAHVWLCSTLRQKSNKIKVQLPSPSRPPGKTPSPIHAQSLRGRVLSGWEPRQLRCPATPIPADSKEEAKAAADRMRSRSIRCPVCNRA